jgi:hypothetical protein
MSTAAARPYQANKKPLCDERGLKDHQVQDVLEKAVLNTDHRVE